MTGDSGWPYGLLDPEALKVTGWRPVPFREFILKVHQRCNLACDYCYVYGMVDQSWRQRPTAMSEEIWRVAGVRIAAHIRRHGLDEVTVVLHGGEPLLAGRAALARMVTGLRAAIDGACTVRFGIQTNGVRLDEEFIAMFQRLAVNVGVSVDGAGPDNDRHRRRPGGAGSYADVRRALVLLGDKRYRGMFGGLLCTVDPASDPAVTYESLLSHRPPRLDFLLPHANWSTAPRRAPSADATPYGDWLVEVFDRWFDAPRQPTRIRLFEEILNLVLGGAGRSEQVGLSPAAIAVVESDGAIEQVDSLKSAYEGAAATGLTVLTDDFDQALAHPGIMARQLGVRALCSTCRACRIHHICGAGHYAHRYAEGTGFLNPSVYCADLTRLIDHVMARVQARAA